MPFPLLLIALVAVMLPPDQVLAATTADASGYWRFADRMQQRLDSKWDEQAGLYRLGAPQNADALLTHSAAALTGHRGRARNDARARRLVRSLLSSPPYVATPPPQWRDAQTHAPGFVGSMTRRRSNQHLVIDSQIVDGLRYAWLARRQLGLSRATADVIARRIHAVATGAYWRWPAMRLNQVGWYALVYAADATVTGDPRMLRRDLRLQLSRFAAGARGSAAVAGNFGAGLHFNYLPHMRRSHPMNLDSAEYANITASFTRVYAQARAAGMPAPAPAARRLLREWMMRVLAGYWTHGGYLNWDTGFGFRRWHQTKKLGLSQQALIGIATAPELAPHPDAPRWAKWMLDRSFAFYDRELERTASLTPPGVLFGVSVVPQPPDSAWLSLTRVQANAARAAIAGLDSKPVEAPPPLYAYDPDTGRLAVTTPAYNTAVVPSNRGAFPYGGIELARLFDGDQEIAGTIGGRPPAAFGLLVRDISGRRVFASQLAGRAARLRLVRAPRGVGARASAWTGRAYAGRFADLRAAGLKRGPGGLVARTRHRFTRGFVETTWTLARRGSGGRQSVDVLFPSWGRRDASVVAVLRDGGERVVGSRRLPLSRIAVLRVRSRHGAGYTVTPLRRPPGATVHALRTRPQSSAPRPGPTLAVQLVRAARYRRATFSARLTPAGGHAAEPAR